MTASGQRILLLGATFDTDNMGVGALTMGAITALIRGSPEVEVALLDYGVVPTATPVQIDGRVIPIRMINLRYSWKVFLPNNIALLLCFALLIRMLPGSVRARAAASNRWLREISEANSAVAVSGGDSFSDIYGMGRFFYVVLPQILVLLLDKPLSLLPQTLGPFGGGTARRLATYVMRRARIVCSRDSSGVAEARKLLGPGRGDAKVRFCYDLGFLLEPRKPSRVDLGGWEDGVRSRPLVGLNVSGLLLMRGYRRDNAFGLKMDYRELVERTIQFLVEGKGADVLLVPHVFGTQAESDVTAAAAVFENLRTRYADHLFCVRGAYDQNEIKHIIGRCEFFIGGRMHACIAALSQAIPAVAIAYSRKFDGVLASIGADDMVADPRQMDMDQVLALVGSSFDSRRETSARLAGRLPGVRQAILDVARDIG